MTNDHQPTSAFPSTDFEVPATATPNQCDTTVEKVTAIDTLLEAAILAPSGDNTQPCRFAVDRDQGSISVDVDPSRDPSPMNAGQRMARIAIGAAVENMIQTAEHNGWKYQLSADGGRVDLELDPQVPEGNVAENLRNRVTNRKKYLGSTPSQSCLDRLLSATHSDRGASATWVTETEPLKKLCELIGRADSILLSAGSARRAFLSTVRFDAPLNADVETGLPLGSLEISSFQRLALRLMPFVSDTMLKTFGGGRMFRDAAGRLARSASGFCLVTTTERGDEADFQVGRMFQRAWLALTAEGMAVQPMMSLVVLRNIVENGTDAQQRPFNRPETRQLLEEFAAFTQERSQGQPSAVLRFGNAAPPTARTGRLPVNRMLVDATSQATG